jgi:spore coat protein A
MVNITRRALLLQGGLASASIAMTNPLTEGVPFVQAMCSGADPRLRQVKLEIDNAPIRPALQVGSLERFVDALPIPPVAQSNVVRPDPYGTAGKIPLYRIQMREIHASVHRDLKPTRFWSYNDTVPGPTIHARRGTGIFIEWRNELPSRHFLPIDHRLHGAESNRPQVRTVVHVHGAKTRHESDGFPEDWYTPGRSLLCHYPNDQDAATLWYHDHAMGINRLNMYAGLIGAYLIHDAAEEALNLPAGEFDIPLQFCDRMFYRDDHQLYYPVSQYIGAPWVPDLHADGTLINGKLFPYLEVQPRKYRFRILNAANNRGFDLALANGQRMIMIGSDQGLLTTPVPRPHVLLAPGERADVVIDFSKLVGAHVELNSGAQGVLQFRVSDRQVTDPSSVPPNLRTIQRFAPVSATKIRSLTLTEHDNRAGDPVAMTLNEAHWYEPVTEKPILDSTEVWEFLNLTDDVHPIHLHLVRFQLLNRQNFHAAEYLRSRKIELTAPPVPPDPAEAGWKDTIQVYPGTVTRIIVRVEGYTGRYLWHCHILEHEANEMMRPFEVLPVTTVI